MTRLVRGFRISSTVKCNDVRSNTVVIGYVKRVIAKSIFLVVQIVFININRKVNISWNVWADGPQIALWAMLSQ